MDCRIQLEVELISSNEEKYKWSTTTYCIVLAALRYFVPLICIVKVIDVYREVPSSVQEQEEKQLN